MLIGVQVVILIFHLKKKTYNKMIMLKSINHNNLKKNNGLNQVMIHLLNKNKYKQAKEE